MRVKQLVQTHLEPFPIFLAKILPVQVGTLSSSPIPRRLGNWVVCKIFLSFFLIF